MTQWQLAPRKKTTGGKIKKNGKKNRYEHGRDYLPTHVGETRVRASRVHGGNEKRIALATNKANVSVAGKYKTAKILSVLENKADSQFVRRNIITKGAIIEKDLGKARVTSRPGQTGVVNAVLLEKK